MPAFSSIALAAGLGLSAGGMGMQFMASQNARRAQEGQVRQEVAGEQTRQAAMKLDASRRNRESIRQSFVSRGAATNAAANEGSQFGDMLPGIQGQISNQSQYNMSGVNQQAKLGAELSGYNIGALNEGSKAKGFQSEAATWAGVSSLGGQIMGNIGGISKLGSNYGLS